MNTIYASINLLFKVVHRECILSILLFFMFSSVVNALAQQSNIIFKHITEKDGLSYNIVNCFLEDSYGFLWIGTYNGLNRFDGSHFSVFKNEKDTSSICHNTVHSLAEDFNKNIWGATDDGIFCYIRNERRFKNYLGAKKGATAGILNILCDKKGEIWAGGHFGLLKYNPTKDSFESMHNLTNDVYAISDKHISKNGMVEDFSGSGIWLATSEGLNYFDKLSGKFYNYKNQSDLVFFNDHEMSALSKSPSGLFWIFDNRTKEILSFKEEVREFLYRIDVSKIMPKVYGATLFEDQSNKVWFSSWSNEIITVEYLNNNKISEVKHSENISTSIAGDFFWAARQDSEGTLWLGTVGGISKSNESHSFYRVHRLQEQIASLNENFSITSISEDPENNTWWIGTKYGFAIQFFPESGFFKIIYARDSSKYSPNYEIISRIQFFDKKVLFVTSEGAYQFDKENNIVSPLSQSFPIFHGFRVIDAVSENDSSWIFSNDNELLRLNLKSRESKTIRYSSDTLAYESKLGARGIVVRPGQRKWMIADINCLAYLDDDQIIPVPLPFDKPSERSGYFNKIDIDSQGRIWFSFKGQGLFCYNPKDRALNNWKETEGLAIDHIMTSTVDKQGKIWCASYNKISVFDPEADKFHNFSLPISNNIYGYINHMIQLSNGNILVNIRGNLVEFFPDKLTSQSKPDAPLIGLLNISGIDRMLNNEDHIFLSHEENFLAFKFGMLSDTEIFPYYFNYTLEGVDNNWVDAGTKPEAVYTNLPPGNYNFRLMAYSKNKAWASQERSILITIVAPFYDTPWFRMLMIFLAIGIFYIFYKYNINKNRALLILENKAQFLEKEKTSVMYENLKQHLNPHFLFNSLTSLGSLIRIDQDMANDFLDNMSKVYRYILKNRDNETIALIEELKFVGLYIRLQKTRFEEGLQIDIEIDEENYFRKIAPVTLQNLLENAIKHNIVSVESPLVISLFIEDDYLVVQNNLQKKGFVDTSNKQGLSSMQSLYKYLSIRPMIVQETNNYFIVKIPLV